MKLCLSVVCLYVIFSMAYATAVKEPIVGGGLEWESLVVERTVYSDAPAVEAEYSFQNTSTAMVTILDIKSSCGCTVSSLEKRTYAPGESGAIKASFSPANKRGKNSVNISARTDVSDIPVRLVLRVEVVERMRFLKRFAKWDRQTESLSPKYLDVLFKDTGDVLELSASSADQAFEVSFEKTLEPLHWRLKISPREEHLTDSSILTRITVKAKTKDGGDLQVVVFAKVD